MGWYEGIEDKNGDWIVEPLCTKAAKELFYNGFLKIKEYIEELKELEKVAYQEK